MESTDLILALLGFFSIFLVLGILVLASVVDIDNVEKDWISLFNIINVFPIDIHFKYAMMVI